MIMTFANQFVVLKYYRCGFATLPHTLHGHANCAHYVLQVAYTMGCSTQDFGMPGLPPRTAAYRAVQHHAPHLPVYLFTRPARNTTLHRLLHCSAATTTTSRHTRSTAAHFTCLYHCLADMPAHAGSAPRTAPAFDTSTLPPVSSPLVTAWFY